eukprot:5428991-Lingulodinium_polyedra.AAC.1
MIARACDLVSTYCARIYWALIYVALQLHVWHPKVGPRRSPPGWLLAVLPEGSDFRVVDGDGGLGVPRLRARARRSTR